MHYRFLTPDHPDWSTILAEGHHDIYHLPGYLDLEARRTRAIAEGILIADGDRSLLMPYLLRSGQDILPDDASIADVFDVVSPYGYPGWVMSQSARGQPAFIAAALQELKRGLQDKGVCSAFLRLHPILNQALPSTLTEDEYLCQGTTVSIDLTLSEADLWSGIRKDHRNRINRANRQGMTARVVPWSEALPTFTDIYAETMARVGAAARYLEFDTDYFTELGQMLGDRLHLCLVEADGDILSAGLYSDCHGIVQALFGGTRTAALKRSPSTLETHCVTLWAKQRGYRWLHLGGGVGASQDPLFRYKAGFSKQRHPFCTLRLITDAAQYQALVELRAKALNLPAEALYQSAYFPAYRSDIGA